MYVPLHLRLTLFYAFALALALCFFGMIVYTQAEQRAYYDLDATLQSRAQSVRIGKALVIPGTFPDQHSPQTLPSVDGLGTGGVAIEILDTQLNLLATTTQDANDIVLTGPTNLGTSPVPWDKEAAERLLSRYSEGSMFSTIRYHGQSIRVYTLYNSDSRHIIQTARSQLEIENSLSDLRSLLLLGGGLLLLLALLGGWLLSWGVLRMVHSMTQTAQCISASHDFSKRVPTRTTSSRDELATLAATLNQMLNSLEEAYQRQQRFIADASHELRAPITSIRCNLDLLAKAPDLPTEEVQEALSDTRAEAERMGRLVSDLLLLARSDEIQPLQMHPSLTGSAEEDRLQIVDLDSLLLSIFRQYRPSENEGTARGPRLALQHIAPARVHADSDQLKQAIVALLDNALKYTPSEGQISLALHVEEHTAVVRVSDSGIGIFPEDLPHIFERFYRANKARNRDRGGSGLGLAIVQSIMQDHQGSVQAESRPGKGSTFTLRLPLAHAQ